MTLFNRKWARARARQTLYIHIGAHRTATTSLQRYLKANADALRAHGLIYPLGVERHRVLMNRIFSGEQIIDRVVARLRAEARKARVPIRGFVLSDEAICRRRDLSALAAFSDHFDVRIVFCLRRQDRWLESWYLQNIKWQWDKDLAHIGFDDFLARREDFFWVHYDAYVCHLEEVFGRDSIDLYTYGEATPGAGPVAAFCDLVGVSDRSEFKPSPHANSSFSPVVSEFMRCLPLDEASDDYRQVLERACIAVSRELPGAQRAGPVLLLDHDRRRAILAEYADGNRQLATRHFGREALFTDPLPPADAPVQRLGLPTDSYELMQSLVAPMMRQLIALENDKAKKC